MKVSRSWVTIITLAILIVIIITGLQIFLNINSKVVQVKDVKELQNNLDLSLIDKMISNKSLQIHTF